MSVRFNRTPLALAALAAMATATMVSAPNTATAASAAVPAVAKTPGKYVAGDFHNHTTCSDGSISMQKLVQKSTVQWGLDWFVQAGHGGSGNRNCTLAEDATLATPAYPLTAQGPTTTWQSSTPAIAPKGLVSGAAPNQNMWRWQSIQEFQYPLIEYLGAYKNVPLFLGIESVVAGHEHASMSVITGQIPLALDTATLPTSPVIAANTSRYTALGNANALAQWEYCFDRNDTDTSRGNTAVGSGIGNNWNCSVTGSANAADTSWNATAQKLIPSGSGVGSGVGTRGHLKTIEAMKWMKEKHPTGSYYVPAHLERAGPFNLDGNNGFNIEHLRNLNNAAPAVAFGFESQPGHGASSDRGEYAVLRNGFTGSATNVDSVGGTTYGGTGVYAAQIGGVWDALLGEGRNWWFFASSDWHNRGSFGPDDRRSTQDFQPGEYQRNYTLVRNGTDKLRPQTIVDGLRTGNNYAASGQLIDRLAFIACASYPGLAARRNEVVENLAVAAATNNTDITATDCATMGEKLVVRPGADIIVSIVVRDPAGSNNSPYTFPNPSLLQVGINQPLDKPAVDHIDVIRGLVTGYKTPGAADYSGEWPRNTNWLKADGTTADLSVVPAGAKNTSAAVIKTFSGVGGTPWVAFNSGVDNTGFLKMTFRIPAVAASQYVRLRGSNLPASVPFETDANGNPLADVYTNASNLARLAIPCTTVHSTGNQFDGCPDHLGVKTGTTQKHVSYDIAAWSDLWFYSNPIFVQVRDSFPVAGVK
jgi:hypothetical protein